MNDQTETVTPIDGETRDEPDVDAGRPGEGVTDDQRSDVFESILPQAFAPTEVPVKRPDIEPELRQLRTLLMEPWAADETQRAFAFAIDGTRWGSGDPAIHDIVDELATAGWRCERQPDRSDGRVALTIYRPEYHPDRVAAR